MEKGAELMEQITGDDEEEEDEAEEEEEEESKKGDEKKDRKREGMKSGESKPFGHEHPSQGHSRKRSGKGPAEEKHRTLDKSMNRTPK